MAKKAWPKRLKVRVTAKDIEAGSRGMAFSCPVARAVKRLLGVALRVDCQQMGWYSGHLYELPADARDWVSDFDGGHAVKPFTFTATRID